MSWSLVAGSINFPVEYRFNVSSLLESRHLRNLLECFRFIDRSMGDLPFPPHCRIQKALQVVAPNPTLPSWDTERSYVSGYPWISRTSPYWDSSEEIIACPGCFACHIDSSLLLDQIIFKIKRNNTLYRRNTDSDQFLELFIYYCSKINKI